MYSALVAAGLLGLAVLPGVPTAAPPQLSVDRSRTNELATLVEADRSTFGGMSLDPRSGTLTIRYATKSGQLAARVRLTDVTDSGAAWANPSYRVELLPVTHSLADLDAVRERVTTDRAWHQVAGAALVEWYADITRNVVAVGVTEVTPKLRAAARAAFGDLVTLHTAVRPEPASRIDSWSPWGGGTRINSGGSGCTSGFPVEVPGTPASRKMITAGHCFPLGARVTNNGEDFGTVSSRNLTNGGKDVEYLAGSYVAWTYKGPWNSDYGDSIKGWQASFVGQLFCTNGATSGEVCAGGVFVTNMCLKFTDGITRCNIDQLVSNSQVLCRPGDSGGNIFIYDSVGLKVGGIIIGTSGFNCFFHPVPAVVPTGWRVVTE